MRGIDEVLKDKSILYAKTRQLWQSINTDGEGCLWRPVPTEGPSVYYDKLIWFRPRLRCTSIMVYRASSITRRGVDFQPVPTSIVREFG